MAKKILALVMAIALVVCFAVSASAASVSTTTEYSNGEAKVIVNVTGAGANANVTYYAFKGEVPVFVYQTEADAQGAAEFDFVTDFENVGSKMLVGYEESDVVADGEDEIEDADKYTITYGTWSDWVYVGAAAAEKTVTFPYTEPAHETFSKVTAEGATVVEDSWDFNGTDVTVILKDFTADVTLDVETTDVVIDGYTGTLDCVDAAIKVVTVAGNDTAEIIGEGKADIDAAVDDIKLTVCGKIDGEYDEYGIIIFESAITETELWSDAFAEKYADYKYKALTTPDEGKFAVQIIDTSKAGAIINAEETYYAAVYAYSATEGVYYVDALDAGAVPVK